MSQSVEFELAMSVEQRDTEWAATTTPFAITMYGASADKARERALKAVLALLDRHKEDLPTYLTRRNVLHLAKERDVEVQPAEDWAPLREARHGVRYEIPHPQKVAVGA